MPTRSRVLRSAPRRKFIWARDSGVGAIDNTSQAFDLLAGFRAAGGSTLGATVTRVRIDFDARFISPTTEGVFMVAGVLVDQLQADEAQVPRPTVSAVGEPHADWMHWRAHYMTHSHSAVLAEGNIISSWEIDVRAQRKMEELGETLWFVLSQSATVALEAGDTGITYNSSVLLRMP